MLMKHFRFFCLPTTLTGLSHGVNFDWVPCMCALRSQQNCRWPFSYQNAAITLRTTPSQTAPKQTSNNLPTLQKCKIDQRVFHVHHGIQMLPRGQRGIRIKKTRIDVLRRQTAHDHTRTNTRKPTANGWSGSWSGQNRNY